MTGGGGSVSHHCTGPTMGRTRPSPSRSSVPSVARYLAYTVSRRMRAGIARSRSLRIVTPNDVVAPPFVRYAVTATSPRETVARRGRR